MRGYVSHVTVMPDGRVGRGCVRRCVSSYRREGMGERVCERVCQSCNGKAWWEGSWRVC